MSNPAPTDQSWIEQFDQRYRPSLRAYFRRRVGNDAEAEDMAQEVLSRLIGQNATQPDDASAYIFSVAANLLRDHVRREAVRRAWRNDQAPRQAEGLADAPAVDWQDPERIVAGRQALAQVRHVIDGLPERTRTIFILYRLEGLARRDIAEAHGISVSAVEKHIATAMKALLKARRDRP